MIRYRRTVLYIIPVALLFLSFALMFGQFSAPVLADAPAKVLAAETETPQPTEPPTEVPTVTPTVTATPTEVATETEQPTLPPQTVVPSPTPLPPAEIPEPITVILFGTGLAALSAAAARRKKAE